MSILSVHDLQGIAAYQNKIRIPNGHSIQIEGTLKFPIWTNATRPASPEVGMVGFNSEQKITEIYDGTEWISVGSSGNPADIGNGGGWSIDQGADAANATGFTTTSMTNYIDSWYLSAGGNGVPLNYTCTGSSANFHFHTGHNGNSTQWPLHFAINVSSAEKGKVLNQCQWHAHGNAIGNVDFYGTNQTISGSNYKDENLYTYLGRGHFGGSGGGGGECTVKTATFNSNNYGYKWYMLKLVDNNSSVLAYPQTGNLGGWAMYGMRLNKV